VGGGGGSAYAGPATLKADIISPASTARAAVPIMSEVDHKTRPESGLIGRQALAINGVEPA
jgi:hypothetical protein